MTEITAAGLAALEAALTAPAAEPAPAASTDAPAPAAVAPTLAETFAGAVTLAQHLDALFDRLGASAELEAAKGMVATALNYAKRHVVNATTLESYLRDNVSAATPVIDFKLRVQDIGEGDVRFYIHPLDKDGETLTFVARGNTLAPVPQG